MRSFVIVEGGRVVAEIYAESAAQAVEEMLINVIEDEKEARREGMAAYPKQVQLTGEMVHDAYCKTVEGQRLTVSWEQASENAKACYERMAQYLNGTLALKRACAEPGYVWSNEESDDYEGFVSPEERRESRSWKAAADLACNWSADAQAAGVEEHGGQ